ncbi:MAG TPA: ABC transporter permease [Polyangiaceae bacterium]
MSAQTGLRSIPPPPPSVRGLFAFKTRFERLFSDPNPVWMRELRAAARLQRTPVILAVITGMMTLLVCSIGGVAAMSSEPARVGTWLYHTFFSLTFAVVTWMGPAVASTTIAAERSGRTWEALELTGLGPAAIARGKFLAALSYVSLYLVMLAPVGALPFLFGGVTAFEIVLAFVLLGVFAVLSVAFGLAMSSKLGSPAVAILATLLVSVFCSIAAYVGLGFGLSYAANDFWPGVVAGAPVWLPTAYVRADFSAEYVALLVLLPFVLIAVPAWLFYEITIANMAPPSDDRSTRLRLWTLVSTPGLTLSALGCGAAFRDATWFLFGEVALFVMCVFVAFVFAGEPLGPSRRVEVHWQREGVSALRRFVGPGVIPASITLVALALGCFGLLVLAGFLLIPSRADAFAVLALGGYAAAFAVFVAGFAAWTRARATGPGVPRVLLLGALFLAFVGPYIAMAIAGVSGSGNSAMLIAAPSPIYAFHMVGEARNLAFAASGAASPDPAREAALLAGAVCAAAWALMGLGLLAVATARVRSRRQAEKIQRETLEASFTAAPAGP